METKMYKSSITLHTHTHTHTSSTLNNIKDSNLLKNGINVNEKIYKLGKSKILSSLVCV